MTAKRAPRILYSAGGETRSAFYFARVASDMSKNAIEPVNENTAPCIRYHNPFSKSFSFDIRTNTILQRPTVTRRYSKPCSVKTAFYKQFVFFPFNFVLYSAKTFFTSRRPRITCSDCYRACYVLGVDRLYSC